MSTGHHAAVNSTELAGREQEQQAAKEPNSLGAALDSLPETTRPAALDLATNQDGQRQPQQRSDRHERWVVEDSKMQAMNQRTWQNGSVQTRGDLLETGEIASEPSKDRLQSRSKRAASPIERTTASVGCPAAHQGPEASGFQLVTASGKPIASGQNLTRAANLFADLYDEPVAPQPSVLPEDPMPVIHAPPAFQLTTASGKKLNIGAAALKRGQKFMSELSSNRTAQDGSFKVPAAVRHTHTDALVTAASPLAPVGMGNGAAANCQTDRSASSMAVAPGASGVGQSPVPSAGYTGQGLGKYLIYLGVGISRCELLS